MGDIWFGGPTRLHSVAEKLSNLFWKEIIHTFAVFAEDVHFSHPYFFHNYNLFDNPLFSINKVELKSSDFSSLWNKKVCQVGDFFNCSKNPPELLSLQELNNKYRLSLNFLNYHRIKMVIINTARNMNFKIYDANISDPKAPKLPLIHKISCLSTKGCRQFYESLKSREWASLDTSGPENKWQTELGTYFSLEFWYKIWKLNKEAIVSNKLRWINLQIYRYILPTNYTVNKYKPNQDPGCSFCQNHTEKLSALVWSCPEVREFWNMVENTLKQYFPQFNLGRKEAIFGDTNSKGDSVINTMLLLAKQFIWREKFGTKSLNEIKYILYMKKELNLLIETMNFKGQLNGFINDWEKILQHFEVDPIQSPLN